MNRKARLDLPNYFYHIICRGQRKQPLYFSQKDFFIFLKFLKELLNETDIKLYSFCLLRNHFHLLVYRTKDSLGKFMHLLNTRYANYFNGKYKRVGYVYQNRFKSFIILNESYLINVLFYIHNNPVKAGIVKREEDYKFSSARFYHGDSNTFIPLKKIPIFAKKNGVKLYKKMLSETKFEIPIFKDGIGTEDEYKELEKRKKGREKGYIINKRKNFEISSDIKTEFEIIFKTLEYSKKDIHQFRLKIFPKKVRDKIVLYLFKKGFNQAQIARFFCINKATVSRIIKKEKMK